MGENMAIHHATKTLVAIEEAIKHDQGAAYRGWLGKVIGHMDDAYRTDEFPFRTHLGASGVGDECERKTWYGFRWATHSKHSGRLLRLFNRGHLEEARFIAMLLTIGAQVYQQDENGKQFKISDAGGHFGGSGDGIVVNLPDLEPGTAALCEFKTSADKPFQEVSKKGVKEAKYEHYVQMQVYMKKMGIAVALYMVVNKNNDDLYAELIPFDNAVAEKYIDKGVKLVWMDKEPPRINNSPGWWKCKWCDHRPVCHLNAVPEVNCRTCYHSKPMEDGTWKCTNFDSDTFGTRNKEEQLLACPKYRRKF